jgi:hypothetical protein
VKNIDLDDVYLDLPRKFVDKCIYHLTINGHRLYPETLLKKEPAIIPFDHCITTQKQTLRHTVIAVNPYLKTGAIRMMDKKKFRKLYKRYNKLLKYYNANHLRIEKEYKDKASYLTSEKFWRKYLSI